LAHVVGDFDDGLAFLDRSLGLNPNLSQAWHLSGYLRAWRAEPEIAIERVNRAIRLSPLDKRIFGMHNTIAHAHFVASRYEEAVSWSKKAIQGNPNYGGGLRIYAASSAHAGRLEQARKAVRRLRELDPALAISSLKDLIPFRRVEDFVRFAEGL